MLLRLVDTRDAGAGFPDLLGPEPRADRLAEFGLREPRPGELARLRTLRDALLPIVLGSNDVARRTMLLNSLLRDYTVTPQLGADGTLAFVSGRSGRVADLAARVLPQTIELLRSGDVSLIDTCQATDCAAPFLAAGRGRRYCSPRCSSRVRVRRFRSTADSEGGQ
ncbi:MAG: CGNR zinc finger domain-containing protein [Mycobacterium sp.]|nr:CGNR zinc finger domain-containing protein [Mycobacterium sp.]